MDSHIPFFCLFFQIDAEKRLVILVQHHTVTHIDAVYKFIYLKEDKYCE